MVYNLSRSSLFRHLVGSRGAYQITTEAATHLHSIGISRSVPWIIQVYYTTVIDTLVYETIKELSYAQRRSQVRCLRHV